MLEDALPLDDVHERLWAQARVSHKATTTLAKALLFERGPFDDAAWRPLVLHFRQAVELYIKAMLVGRGRYFLQRKPDPKWVLSTRSLRRLLPRALKILRAADWEEGFPCGGLSNPDDLGAFILALDNHSFGTQAEIAAHAHSHSDLSAFIDQMNALLVFLDAANDAVLATWDMKSEGIDLSEFSSGSAIQ